MRRFIAKEEKSVLVTGRLPDVDSSRILPVVEKVDRALDGVRKQHPEFRISVTGLPAVAARNSARMISQLNEALPLCVAFAAVLLAIAFRSVVRRPREPAAGPLSRGRLGRDPAWTWTAGWSSPPWWRCWWCSASPSTALIHFFNRLSLEERKEPRADIAIRNARVLVGPAIILTTLVLAFGLGVTVFSDLPPCASSASCAAPRWSPRCWPTSCSCPRLIMLVRKVWRHKVVG